MSIPDSERDRFWARVEKTDRCWFWLQYRRYSRRMTLVRARGYGIFRTGSKTYSAHKLAYLLVYGAIGPGLVVRHLCGDSRCVNPEHLRIGTQSENMQDYWFHRVNPGVLIESKGEGQSNA